MLLEVLEYVLGQKIISKAREGISGEFGEPHALMLLDAQNLIYIKPYYYESWVQLLHIWAYIGKYVSKYENLRHKNMFLPFAIH